MTITKTNKIREVRELNKLTQSHLAELINVTERTMRHYEKGERMPDVLAAILIANALKVKTYEEFKQLFMP